jgi:parallel beta-helix repeat protein
MNRAVFALVAILFLLSVSSITGLIQVVKADGETIYINADGSISPPTAPIYTADNITYTLTGNITVANDGIDVERNNIVLNGAGYTVTGGLTISNGIRLWGVSNVTVENMMITNFSTGIYVVYSSNNTLYGNNVAAKYAFGIVLGFSSGNTLSENNVTANIYDGIDLDSSSSNTLYGNTVTANGKHGIYLVSSSNNILSGNNVANNYWGIELSSSSNNSIYDNDFINNTQSQVISSNSTNAWDNGSSGNYWSDYLTRYPNATEVDSSGVWNTPYVIDTNNTDHYPLTVPIVVLPEFQSIQATMLFMLLTLLAVIVYKKKGVKSAS